MRKISREELEKILEDHKEWLEDKTKGKMANLSYISLLGVNLSFINLSCANLSGADLTGANLTGANLSCTNLSFIDLSGANLIGADLRGADLINSKLRRTKLKFVNLAWANLSCADLNRANLTSANLTRANLIYADLNGAILDNVITDYSTIGYPLACPEKGSFIGYKKLKNYIIELEIPAESKRSSATTRKCRCSKAKVLSITNIDGSDSGLTEIYNDAFNGLLYKIGELVEVEDFDDNRWEECSAGLHFFITRNEAVNYYN